MLGDNLESESVSKAKLWRLKCVMRYGGAEYQVLL